MITVRPVADRDAETWAVLYRAYRDFYRLEPDEERVERTWQWVVRGQHGLTGLVAVDESDRPVALANLRWFARPSTSTIGLFLDDLFTGPEARGRGAGTALLRRAAEMAGEAGASVVRWMTDEDNHTARRVYDSVGTLTRWVTYDMAPAAATTD